MMDYRCLDEKQKPASIPIKFYRRGRIDSARIRQWLMKQKAHRYMPFSVQRIHGLRVVTLPNYFGEDPDNLVKSFPGLKQPWLFLAPPERYPPPRTTSKGLAERQPHSQEFRNDVL